MTPGPTYCTWQAMAGATAGIEIKAIASGMRKL